jgi:hypothetical protein
MSRRNNCKEGTIIKNGGVEGASPNFELVLYGGGIRSHVKDNNP